MTQWPALAVALAAALGALRAQAPSAARTAARTAVPPADYYAYVLSEAADRISIVRFGPDGLRVEKEIDTKIRPHQVNGPHGIAVAPDTSAYYVSVAHGTPYGSLLKYATGTDSLLGAAELGMFPATVSLSPDGAFAFVANFNFQGEMVPSSISVVATSGMFEVARTTTCTMPHGSRVDPRGARHYSVCMMEDVLIEMDTRTFRPTRHFVLAKGREAGGAGLLAATAHGAGHSGSSDAAPDHGMQAPAVGDLSCSPTWAQPTPDGSRVFVACNKSNDVVEIDVRSWTLVRRLAAGDGVYNLAVTFDGRLLLGTNKRAQSLSVIDIARGAELARVPTRRKVVHGVAVTRDDRFAFVTEEGLSNEPGTLEVIDLEALRSVASIDLPPQAAGVELWKMVPRSR